MALATKKSNHPRRWDPFKDYESFFDISSYSEDLWDSFYKKEHSKVHSNVRWRSEDDCLLGTFKLPGIKKENVSVVVDGVILKVKINQKLKDFEHSSEYKYSFNSASDLDSIHCKMEDGLLTIKVPNKQKEEKVKKINIE